MGFSTRSVSSSQHDLGWLERVNMASALTPLVTRGQPSKGTTLLWPSFRRGQICWVRSALETLCGSLHPWPKRGFGNPHATEDGDHLACDGDFSRLEPERSILPDASQCSGRPKYAPTLVDLAKWIESSIADQIDNATKAPTPGMVMKRRQTSDAWPASSPCY